MHVTTEPLDPGAPVRTAPRGAGVVGRVTLFGFAGGAALLPMVDALSRGGLAGLGWALLLLVVGSSAILAAGWTLLALLLRGDRRWALGALLAGTLALVLALGQWHLPFLVRDLQWEKVMDARMVITPVMHFLGLAAGAALATLFGRLTSRAVLVSLHVWLLVALMAATDLLALPLLQLLLPLAVALPLLLAPPPGPPAPWPGITWTLAGVIVLPLALIAGILAVAVGVGALG